MGRGREESGERSMIGSVGRSVEEEDDDRETVEGSDMVRSKGKYMRADRCSQEK